MENGGAGSWNVGGPFWTVSWESWAGGLAPVWVRRAEMVDGRSASVLGFGLIGWRRYGLSLAFASCRTRLTHERFWLALHNIAAPMPEPCIICKLL
jgi:hypothetical protein